MCSSDLVGLTSTAAKDCRLIHQTVQAQVALPGGANIRQIRPRHDPSPITQLQMHGGGAEPPLVVPLDEEAHPAPWPKRTTSKGASVGRQEERGGRAKTRMRTLLPTWCGGGAMKGSFA